MGVPRQNASVNVLQVSDPRVADLVRAGRVRVALFPPMYTKDPATGEVGGMAMDLTRALAARLGIEVLPVEYATPGDVVAGLNAGTCDVAFLAIDPVRTAAVDFSPPYVERDFTYLVPTNSSIGSATDADQSGIRIAVVRTHASTLALSHIVQHAELVQKVWTLRSTCCAAGKWTSWPQPDRICSSIPSNSLALACCRIAMGQASQP